MFLLLFFSKPFILEKTHISLCSTTAAHFLQQMMAVCLSCFTSNEELWDGTLVWFVSRHQFKSQRRQSIFSNPKWKDGKARLSHLPTETHIFCFRLQTFHHHRPIFLRWVMAMDACWLGPCLCCCFFLRDLQKKFLRGHLQGPLRATGSGFGRVVHPSGQKRVGFHGEKWRKNFGRFGMLDVLLGGRLEFVT